MTLSRNRSNRTANTQHGKNSQRQGAEIQEFFKISVSALRLLIFRQERKMPVHLRQKAAKDFFTNPSLSPQHIEIIETYFIIGSAFHTEILSKVRIAVLTFYFIEIV